MNSGSFSMESYRHVSDASDLDENSLLLDGKHRVCYTRSGDELSISYDKRTTSHVESKARVNLKSASLIFVSLSCGAAILVLPFTVVQIGLAAWIFFVPFILFLLILCAYLNNESTLHMLSTRQENAQLVRDPYPSIAELAGGRVLRIFTVASMYATNLSACISWILLSATVLRDLVPMKHISGENEVRVWTLVVIIILTPLMYLGSYSDLKVPAILAISSSSISAVCIITNCLIARYQYNITSDVALHKGTVHDNTKFELVFLAYGSICFSASGAGYSIPNITVLASSPNKLHRALVGSCMFIFLFYVLTGTIPYFVFGSNVSPSVSTTFYYVMLKYKVSALFHVMAVISQVCMTFHFMMVSILTLNPCYQHIEDFFNIPHDMGWKRVVARTSIMVFVFVLCACVPRFAPILSVTGGVPFSLVGIIFPIVIYIRLFEVNVFKKLALILLLIFSIAFVLGNFISSVLALFKKDDEA